MKLALGTVQFGMDYGVSNTGGRVAPEEVARILDAAEAAGIELLDTAWGYGDAEEVLGSFGAGDRFKIVTKTAPLDENGARGIAAELGESLTKLGAMPAYGLLVHSANDLLGDGGEDLAKSLIRSRENGAVEHLGVSVYTAEQLFAALDVLGSADLVQVPVNVFDQRLLQDGTLAELKARNIEVHARSAFLQGLLLMDPATLPAYFEPIRDCIVAWRAFCAERDLTPLAAALGFVTGLAEVDHVVVGVESAEQLAEVIASAAPLDSADFAELALDDPAYLDPSQWQLIGARS